MSTQYNQSLSGGVRMLQEVLSHPVPLGSRELAKILGEEHSRVSRMLATLHSEGFLNRTPKGKYYPGSGVHVLAALSMRNSQLLRLALPELKGLKSARRTVALGVLWRDSVCFIVHSRPHQTLEDGIGSHELYPASKSSLGVMLLSESPETSEHSLETVRRMEAARRDGFARVDFEDGTASIAVPVGSPAIAAIGCSIVKPSAKELEECLELVKVAGKAIGIRVAEEESLRYGRETPCSDRS